MAHGIRNSVADELTQVALSPACNPALDIGKNSPDGQEGSRGLGMVIKACGGQLGGRGGQLKRKLRFISCRELLVPSCHLKGERDNLRVGPLDAAPVEPGGSQAKRLRLLGGLQPSAASWDRRAGTNSCVAV